MAYHKLNFTNISVSNAKKIEFKLNILFYNIHLQHEKPEKSDIGRRQFRLKQTLVPGQVI